MQVGDNSKKFEKAKTGDYIGVVADIVDLGKVATNFGIKPKVRIVWVLNAKDSEGNYYRTIQSVVASMNQKSSLYKIVKDILGTDPPVPYELEHLIGQSRRLIIQTEPDKRSGEPFANIRVILPLGDQPAMQVPADFVRAKDRPQTGSYGSGNTNVGQQAAPAAQAVNLNAAPAQSAPAAPADNRF